MNSPEGIASALSKLSLEEVESYWLSISPVSTLCLAENAQECKNSPHMCTAAHIDSFVFFFKLKYSCFVMLCFHVYRVEILLHVYIYILFQILCLYILLYCIE